MTAASAAPGWPVTGHDVATLMHRMRRTVATSRTEEPGRMRPRRHRRMALMAGVAVLVPVITSSAAVAGPGAEPDGCTFAVRATPTVLTRAHGHAVHGRWQLSAAAACPAVADMKLSADLTRNGIPLQSEHLTASCGGAQLCGSLTVGRARAYSRMTGRWQP